MIYKGIPERTAEGGFKVLVDGKLLSPKPSQELYNHSPDGFAWGYGGSGPAQLALALLLDVTKDKEVALANYQTFKGDVIAGLPLCGEFELSEAFIRGWLVAKKMMERALLPFSTNTKDLE